MPGKPFCAGTAVSTTHCGAGCVLGDVIAEWMVFAGALHLLGLALPAEYLLDYALALSWGILFQCFVIAPMCQLGTGTGLKLAAKADFLALSVFEVGLSGWMATYKLVLSARPGFLPIPPRSGSCANRDDPSDSSPATQRTLPCTLWTFAGWPETNAGISPRSLPP